MITATQKNKIIQVINVFETGTKEGKYDLIATYPDGRGGSRQITYGRSQTTEQGNLKALIEKYISNKGVFSGDFKIYIPKIGKIPLVDDAAFKNLLKKAAKQDPICENHRTIFLKFFTISQQYIFSRKINLRRH